MRKLFLVIVLSIFSHFGLNAQQLSLDSLKVSLSQTEDKELKLKIVDEITGLFLKQKNFDSLAVYNFKALNLSENLNDTMQMMRFNTEVGMDYYGNGDYQNAKKYYLNTLNLYQKFTADSNNLKQIDDYRYSLITNNIGAVYTKLGLYDSAIYYLVISTSEKERLKVSDKKLLVSYYNLSGLCVNKNDLGNAMTYTNLSLQNN